MLLGSPLVGLFLAKPAPAFAAPPVISADRGEDVKSAHKALDISEMGLQSGQVIFVPEAVHGADGRTAQVQLALGEDLVTLQLVKHRVRADSFQMIADRGHGRYESIVPPPVETYRGFMLNDPGSIVAVSILPEGIAGRLRRSDGRESWIEPLAGRVNGAQPGQHVIYTSEDVAPFDGRCGVENNGPIPPLGDHGGHSGLFVGELCSAQIAIDCDYPFYVFMGEDLQYIGRRIDLILNTMNVQYNTEVGIDHTLTLVMVRVNEASDPYVGDVFCSDDIDDDILDQMRVIWDQDLMPNIPRDIVHLFTGRTFGSIIGCNFEAVVCGGGFGDVYSYGGSRIDFNGVLASSTDLLAHELGHGWGAPHCNCFNPPYTMHPNLVNANTFQPDITVPVIVQYRNTWNECLDCNGDPTVGCGSGNSTCYNESSPGSQYCTDESCCIIVCSIDPFCCSVDWDGFCGQTGRVVCAGCGTAEAGNPFADNGNPGCSDLGCCEAVCTIDSYCCSTTWDDVCSDKALAYCTNCGEQDAGSPFEVHGPGCEDSVCCAYVCAIDEGCCNVEWDDACVAAAVELCSDCGSEEAGSPFLNKDTPGSDDIACCQAVCSEDPFCCETQWDGSCASRAVPYCPGWCKGDLNFDGIIDGADLGLLISYWGIQTEEYVDLDGDGTINGADLGVFLGNWGLCDY